MSNHSSHVNPVCKRFFVYLPLKLISPMSPGIGKSDSAWSDHDILRNSRGNALLSGTTIAGNFRHALKKEGVSDDSIDNLLGSSVDPGRTSLGEQSRLWVMESEINDADVLIRDGVALDAGKQAIDQRKFDMEAIATGAVFNIRLELMIRKNDLEKDGSSKTEETFLKLLALIRDGAIRFGAKTNRGYGRTQTDMEKAKVIACDFTSDPKAIDDWIAFRWPTEEKDGADWQGLADCWKLPETVASGQETRIEVDLTLLSSILIRSDDHEDILENTLGVEGNGDFKSHIHCGKVPVIPGTSWSGVFRANMRKILIELASASDSDIEKVNDFADDILDDIFGQASESSDEADSSAKASKIRFEEGTLHKDEEGGYILTTRACINRFTGGISEGSLFTTMPWYRGGTKLEIAFPKEDSLIRELVMMVLYDLNDGLVSVGGETGVGRGRFSLGELRIDGKVEEKLPVKFSEIAAVLQARKVKKGGGM